MSPARVAAQHRGGYVVYTEGGERPAEVAGRLRHAAAAAADLPAVGDWVAVEDGPSAAAATIHAVLERSTVFSRKTAGEEAAEQVVAANVDVVFLVSAFGEDLNVRRIERYLASGWESGAQPVIVLNKSDLAEDLAAAVAEVEAVAFGVPVHVVSCLDGAGMDELEPYLVRQPDGGAARFLRGRQVLAPQPPARLGAPERANPARRRQGPTHDDATGSSCRSRTAGSSWTRPGMRELGLWSAETGVDETFSDLAELAAGCRFTDCAHESEPGCAVRAAIADGRLPEERLSSYRKLQRELERLELEDRSACTGGGAPPQASLCPLAEEERLLIAMGLGTAFESGRLSRVGILRPLRIRDFALLWAGATVSLAGDGVYVVALAWQVYELSDSPTALSLVGVAWTLPLGLFVLLGGVVSDRFERRRIMIARRHRPCRGSRRDRASFRSPGRSSSGT